MWLLVLVISKEGLQKTEVEEDLRNHEANKCCSSCSVSGLGEFKAEDQPRLLQNSREAEGWGSKQLYHSEGQAVDHNKLGKIFVLDNDVYPLCKLDGLDSLLADKCHFDFLKCLCLPNNYCTRDSKPK